MQSDIVAPPTDSKQEQPVVPPPVMSQPAPVPQAAAVVEEQKPEPVDQKTTAEPQQPEPVPAQTETEEAAQKPKHHGTPGPGIAIFWAVLLCGVFIGLAIYITMQNA